MNIESALVSFGNFLFARYGVNVYSNDGRNQPLYQRKVTDADLRNWEHSSGMVANGTGSLPSRFKIGDRVRVSLADSGRIENCEIIRVHFTESKVMYDIAVKITIEAEQHQTRLYNVDSAFISEA